MKKADAGWLCVANPNWLDFLAQLPNPAEVVYYKGPFRPTTRLRKGSPFICCRNGELPRRIHLVGRFDGFKVMSLAEAWRTFEVKLGVANEARWIALNPGNDGRVSCHLLSDVQFLDPPVPLRSTQVILNNAASSMGRYLFPEEVQSILAIACPTPTVARVAVAANLNWDVLSEDLNEIDQQRNVDSTTKKALVDARLGQGKFRSAVFKCWANCCSVTGSTIQAAIRASHIKPWRESNNSERLDPNNGLPLVASLDALFDAGLISFDPAGKLVISATVTGKEREVFGISESSLRKKPTAKMAEYLSYHREKHGFDQDDSNLGVQRLMSSRK